jgi:hypothetical protein
MKRTIFLFALTLIALSGFVGRVHAQEGAKVGFRASPLIGWANTVVDSTKTKPTGLANKAGLGFAFDFVFTYGFSESFAFKTGVTIATKTIKSEIDFLASVAEQKVSFTAIEVPVGFKFRSPEIGDGMYIVGHFGLNPEINVQNKVTTEIPGFPANEQIDVDGIRMITGSFAPGAGLDWEFDWGTLEFAATYHWGLLPYTNPDDFGGLKSRMNAIALNIGYFF